ncbi:hypothetical protein ACQZ5N_03360 [Agrobacterium sp. 22-221-1]|nr:hypothetical protein FY137_07050 [Agrobacterium tumefaciens]
MKRARPSRPDNDELLEILAHMQVANNVAIIALVKALEDSGAVRAEEYEEFLRGIAARMHQKGDNGPASLLDDLADRLKRDKVTKQ